MRRALIHSAIPALLGLALLGGCTRTESPDNTQATATPPATQAPATTSTSAPAVDAPEADASAAADANAPAVVAARPAAPVTLFRNVRVFDGKSSALSEPRNVLVRGNIIENISADTIEEPTGEGATVIDGNGRTLMPGLIDAHWHALLAGIQMPVLMTSPMSYVQLVAAHQAERTLMQGFTTVRDLGGPAFGLKRAIDEGLVVGPRIYPSGAMISQTAGHGDFRTLYEVPRLPNGMLSFSEREGISAIADSPDEVRMRVREQLRMGASQIKLTAGGGVNSPYGDIASIQFTEQELRAAVEATEAWGGSYVTAHAYTTAAVRQAIAAGVKVIDHGQLIDEPTAQLMSEKGIWWSLQPLIDNEDMMPMRDPGMQQRALEVFRGTDNAYRLAKKHKVKTAFGADILFSPHVAARRHGAQLALLLKWYTPAEALKMATADNGELMALSGRINPYPGRLGVVEQGALADLLLVDGNPLENLRLIENPDRNFVVIMKNGRIFKNTSSR
ncbi:imidazolonepropionase-like amidohydrolase [Luteimonas cucumeris]|uniref:Imidazolonepropionase-like amidohydrolase n=1 Tax=Luteimonas cucumeris TaxID=985012 RepID=A0A562LAM8_9GAMM|nr:amidohydrolase family protein [Luteimonas cucumeris]TWI04615.1 imidazolonepropionase-like amidohydrolase [Luteimonas cucumeris]